LKSTITFAMKVDLSMDVKGSGFHRVVDSRAALDEVTGDSCVVVMDMKLPASVYVDVDEIQEKMRLKDLKDIPDYFACLSGPVDIEKPAELSEPLQIKLGRISHGLQEVGFQFPLHLRYQMPTEAGGYRRVQIALPQEVWITCDSDFTKFELTKPDTKWEQLEVESAAPDLVVMQMPVGSREDAVLVNIVTALVTMLGALVLTTLAFQSSRKREKVE